MCPGEGNEGEKKNEYYRFERGLRVRGVAMVTLGFSIASQLITKKLSNFSLSNEYNLEIISSVTNFSTGKEEFRPECPLLKEERGEHPSGDNFVFLFVFEK